MKVALPNRGVGEYNATMIVIDIESSGTEAKVHSILSLGAIDFDNLTDQFYEECRAWEGAHIMDDALEVNGFSREEATDPAKKTEAELITAFLAWCKDFPDRTFAGQNVSFDRDFVKEACHRAGLDNSFAHRTIDTHTLCWMHMVRHGAKPPIDPKKHHSSLNLDAVLNYTGIPNEPEPHNALTGAMSHAEVISRLLYDKKLLPEFSAYEVPWK